MEKPYALDLVQAKLDKATDPEEISRLEVIATNIEKGWTIRKEALEKLTVSAAPKASMQSWRETLYAVIADGTPVTGAAKTALVPDFTLPANYLYPGRTIMYTLYGKMSTVITTPGTWTMSLNWGGSAGTVLAASGAYAPDSAAASTNIAWRVEYLMTCRSVGTSGSAVTFGQMDMGDYSTTAATMQAQIDMNTFPDAPAAVTIDTTTAKAITPAITPSVGTGSMTAMLAILEALT
jgi:hypothetical protein